MLYVLVYKKMIFRNGLPTEIVGPFNTPQEASAWYALNTPDAEAEIDVIYTPKKDEI